MKRSLRALLAALGCLMAEAAAVRAQVVASHPPEFSHTLAVATFDSAWDRIYHTHYDSTFHGVDWHAVRTELRPRAEQAGSLAELRQVLRDMLARLGESHYTLIPGELADAMEADRPASESDNGYPGDLGLELRLVDGRLAVFRVDSTGPAAVAGVHAGWVVEAIGEWRPAEALQRLAGLAGTEQRNARTQFLYSANAQAEGTSGTLAVLQLRDGEDRSRSLRIPRRRRPGEPIHFGNLPTFIAKLDHVRLADGSGCVGIIRFNVWMVPLMHDFDQAVDDVRDCRGIVLDIRGNPGGVAGMVMGVSGHFLNQPTSLGTMRQRGNSLDFVANPRRVDTHARAVEPFAGRLAVLIDGMSVSTSEIFAGGMQAIGRARVFGETSAGQALPAGLVRLPDGDVLMHVLADFTAAGGTRIEGKGVTPDQAVVLHRADLLAGRDPTLEAALTWIHADSTR